MGAGTKMKFYEASFLFLAHVPAARVLSSVSILSAVSQIRASL